LNWQNVGEDRTSKVSKKLILFVIVLFTFWLDQLARDTSPM